MKKLWICLLALMFTVCATACETRSAQPPSNEPSSASESEPKPEPEPEPESSEEPKDEPEPVDADGAKQATEELLAALQTGNPDAIRTHIDYRNLLQLDNSDSPEASLLAILKKLQYEITGVEASQNSAQVTVKLTNLDMAAILNEYLKQCMELEMRNAQSESPLPPEDMEPQYQQLFYDTLDQNAAATISRTVAIKLRLDGQSWKAQVSDDLRDGVTGNYFAARSQTGNNAAGGQA